MITAKTQITEDAKLCRECGVVLRSGSICEECSGEKWRLREEAVKRQKSSRVRGERKRRNEY
jgi:hypothetical protein